MVVLRFFIRFADLIHSLVFYCIKGFHSKLALCKLLLIALIYNEGMEKCFIMNMTIVIKF